jgi:hypothetical protein
MILCLFIILLIVSIGLYLRRCFSETQRDLEDEGL